MMSPVSVATNLSSSSMNIEFIRYIKCAGVLVNLNGITKYSYNLYLMENAILGISSDQILI
jgi:hypothetical protein